VAISRSRLTHFLQSRPHTRVPVYRNSLDKIVGIVNSKDLEHLNYRELSREMEHLKTGFFDKNGMQQAQDDSQSIDEQILDLTPLVFEAAFVPEMLRVDKLLTEFKKFRQQIAIVVDEYGGTAGLVALADLLEELFGEMPDETDETEPEILKLPDGRLQLAGRVTIDRVNDIFGFGFPSDEAETVAGLVLNDLGRIASVGDEVEINGFHLRVEQVDRFRITALTLTFPAEEVADV